jgi:hypothetical protein
MPARVRGHYRIDASGRIEPLLDVNEAALPYTLPKIALRREPMSLHSHMKQIILAGVGICVVLSGLVAMLPRIERLILSEQARQIAMARADYIQKHPTLESLLKHH